MATFREKGFPKTAKFFTGTLFKLPFIKPVVFQKFVEFSQLTGKEAALVLWPGTNPLVRLKYLPGLYGWTPPTGDEIHLDETFIKNVEGILNYHYPPSVYDYYRIKDATLLLLEATIMHELVHYGRKIVNGYTPNLAREEFIAQEFERKAYGKRYTAENLQIDTWIKVSPIPRPVPTQR